MDEQDVHRHQPPRYPLLQAHPNQLNQLPSQLGEPTRVRLTRKPRLPHHESLLPSGNLVTIPSPVTHYRNLPRILDQDLADQKAMEQKRLSQASAASSTRSKATKDVRKSVGPWELGMDLGKGMSGSVRKARHCVSGAVAAVKIINLQKAAKLQTFSILAMDKHARSTERNSSARKSLPMVLQREIAILKAMNHPNVIKLFDIWEAGGELYLFTEYVHKGELFDYILKHHFLPEHEAVRLYRQIVSGLQYCHRFLLCHRDIKPENILLDELCNVKLADFGMAAMHNNQMLHTSCGSPHYAAPEIVTHSPYRGSLVDIWSSGVVLYVMLVGKLPFGWEHDLEEVNKVIDDVLYAPIDFTNTPVPLTERSKDLIIKILERDPRKRITIEKMWHHPLFQAYEAFARKPGHRKHWLGGPLGDLTVDDLGPQMLDAGDVDAAILEGLCTLWQTSDESRLMARLLNSQPCLEKVMYNCLYRYRVEQEESFRAGFLEASPADYHHVAPRHVKRNGNKASLLGPGVARQQSQFSIVAPTTRQQSSRSRQTARSKSASASGSGSGSACHSSLAGTDATYDPYRSSRPQVVYDGSPYTRVDVYRNGSVASRALSHSRNRYGRPPVSSVWESTVGSSPSSMPSSPPELPRDVHGRVRTLRHTAVQRCYSKSSLASSANSQGSGRSVRFRKTHSYKRNVSFRGVHDMPPRPRAPTPLAVQQRYLQDRLHEAVPALKASPGNRKSSGGASLPDLKLVPITPLSADTVRRSKYAHSSLGIHNAVTSQEAAARASSELSQYCDAAFSSSPQQPLSDDVFVESPTPAVVSSNLVNAALAARLSSLQPGARVAQKPPCNRDKSLPEPPMREPHALQVQRELAKALRTLKEREKEIGDGLLDKAMAEIERIMRLNAPGISTGNYQHRMTSIQDRRTQSEHQSRLLREDPFLSPVKEDLENLSHQQDSSPNRRYVSDPLPLRMLRNGVAPQLIPGPTIRMVPESSAIALPSDEAVPSLGGGVALDPNHRIDEPRVIPNRRDSREFDTAYGSIAEARNSLDLATLEKKLHTIREDDDADQGEGSKRSSGGSKFKGLFRRSAGSDKSLEKKTEGNRPHESSGRVDQWQNHTHHALAGPEISCGTDDSEFPSRIENLKPLRGFWSLFKRDKRDSMHLIEPGDAESVLAPSSHGSHTTADFNSSIRNFSRYSGPGDQHTATTTSKRRLNHGPYPSLASPASEQAPTNWLSRLLQVRPAHRTLAFDVHRARMMKEIRAVFRDWRRFGVRDIFVEKSAGRIWARLGQGNGLGLKPVEILVEAYAVVYTGGGDNAGFRERDGPAPAPGTPKVGGGGMSIARLQQVRGAKSSFEKCAAQLERICVEKGLLVTARKKMKAMKKCLKEHRK